MNGPDIILALVNRSPEARGESRVGEAHGIRVQDWDAGNRDRELRLHLLFLAWYCNLEPSHLTRFDETVTVSARFPVYSQPSTRR